MKMSSTFGCSYCGSFTLDHICYILYEKLQLERERKRDILKKSKCKEFNIDLIVIPNTIKSENLN
jgi:shikimate kinase